MSFTAAQIAAVIDHTLLKPETTVADIDRLCDEAGAHSFATVCVNSYWTPRCVERLRGSSVRVASVAGFPLGANLSAAKADEARRAVDSGAWEIDMVANLGLLRDLNAAVTEDIAAVVSAVRQANSEAIVKVILETGALTDEQIIFGCCAAREAGADFVKTSTGFHASGGATVRHVHLLREHAGRMRVKASGGIRDFTAAVTMLQAGADRLGTSSGVAIMTGAQGTSNY